MSFSATALNDGGNWVNDGGSDVAVIGMSFEFPGADSVESFWDMLMCGRQAAVEFPQDRLCRTKFHGHDETRNVIHPKKACFLSRDISAFDARFFSMAAEEAIATDPQQRILLQTTYRALENAGIPMDKVWGTNTSVHTGNFTQDYTLLSAKDPENGPKYAATGMAGSMLSNRISTFFNLSGPSASLDTACSSSLVALDMGCRSIRLGDSSMGIVAGCNILHTADYFMSLSKLGFLSPDGVCHSFDERANGYGRGEGFGVLIIKSVDAAIRDGDTIRAVIRSTRTNQNGRTNLAQPSKEMQTKLIEATYRNARLDMGLTRYFEAHGTGTAVGDPLEAMAIGNAFGRNRDPKDPLLIGALKANIGHLEGAAGIAGVIKTILILERGIIPPIADLGKLNSSIDADFLKLQFPETVKQWPKPGLRRASVNSFGFGGTNSHVVLDDAFHYLSQRGLTGHHCTAVEPLENGGSHQAFSGVTNGVANGLTNGHTRHSPTPSPTINGVSCNGDTAPLQKLFVFSAHEQPTLSRLIELYQRHLEQESAQGECNDDYLTQLAYTLSQRRSHHSWRTFALANSVIRLLEEVSASRQPICAGTDYKIGLVFTGQGSQWRGMGKELISFSSFQDSIAQADRFLRCVGCTWQASDMLFKADDLSKFDDPYISQPLCTILQVALVDLLRTLNIHPTAVIGHSSGEIAAAYAVGAICKESAWKLAYYRGLLSSKLGMLEGQTPGAMMAVGLSQQSFQPYLEKIRKIRSDGTLCIACVNSPQNITVSGDADLVQGVQRALETEGIFTRTLRVPVAYHSAHMESIVPAYRDSVNYLKPGDLPLTYAAMISSVTGDVVSPDELRNVDYWCNNMVSPVLFSEAVSRVYRDSTRQGRKKLDLSHRNFVSVHGLLEVGPHSTLRGPIREVVREVSSKTNAISYLSCLERNKSAMSTLLEMVGEMYCRGVEVNLTQANITPNGFHRSLKALPDLPEYPFNDSQAFWNEPAISKNIRLTAPTYNEFLGTPVPDWNPLEPRWRNNLKSSSISWLKDHKVNGEILYPGAGMLVMAIEAMNQISAGLDIVGYEIKKTSIISPLSVPEDNDGVEVQFRLKPNQDTSNKSSGWASFALYSCSNEVFMEVCRGYVKAIIRNELPSEFKEQKEQHGQHIAEKVRSATLNFTQGMAPELLYERALKNGYYYGPSFQKIESAKRNGCGELIGVVGVDTTAGGSVHQTPAVIHPGSLDSMFQLMLLAVHQDEEHGRPSTWIPTYVPRMRVSRHGLLNTTGKAQVQVLVSTQLRSSRLSASSMYVVGKDEEEVLLQTEGFEMTSITDNLGNHGLDQQVAHVKRLCYDLEYKPDPTLVDHQQMTQHLRELPDQSPAPSMFYQQLGLYVLALMERTLLSVSHANIAPEAHLQQQHDWMQSSVKMAKLHTPPGVTPPWWKYTEDREFQDLGERLQALDQIGAGFVQASKFVERILRGEASATDVLLESPNLKDVLAQIIEKTPFPPTCRQYLDILAHKNASMKVLDIGTGFGSNTKHILDALTMTSTNSLLHRFSSYRIVASSLELVEEAKEQFGALPNMSFGVADVASLHSDGDVEHLYDLIIVTNVLDSHTPLQHTLANLGKMLRDDGRLVLFNTDDILFQVCRLILMLFAESIPDQSLVRDHNISSEVEWEDELRSAGFTGIDLMLRDEGLEGNLMPFMIASSLAPTAAKSEPNGDFTERHPGVFTISGFTEPTGCTLTANVMSVLENMESSVPRESTFQEAAASEDLENKIAIIIQHSSWADLSHLNARDYAAFHAVLSKSKAVMWLSDSSQFTDTVDNIGVIRGLARTLRMEKQGSIFITTVVDSSRKLALPTALRRSVQNLFAGVRGAKHEPELVQIGDTLSIPRLYENDHINRMVSEYTAESVRKERAFGEQNVKLSIQQPGLLDTLFFEEIETITDLEPHEVEIEVKAVGVTFKDCLVALGRVAEDTIGTECAGIVRGAGNECKLQIGDRVFVQKMDSFRGRVRCHEKLAAKMPQAMSYVEAAGSVTNFVTAYHSLIRLANIQRGERVLIHAGAGGTGQAAIQIAQLCGATVFTTTSSSEKRHLLTETYGIPETHIFNSRGLDFVHGIKRLTQGKGVDAVLNSLAGDALVASWECIAPYGRFIEIGKRDIFSHNELPMYQFGQNVTFSAVDIGAMTRDRPEVISEILNTLAAMFDAGKLRVATPSKVFPVSEVEMAFRHLQSGNNAGTAVVEIEAGTLISVATKSKPQCTFEADATYLIAGGLGGQGRSIAKWMVNHGARNLVLLSRSGAASDGAVSFVHELQDSGAKVDCPRCDIADSGSLHDALVHCRKYMPPIKGCIQAAMNLRDGIFDNMSVEAWTEGLGPKVAGSWNLHEQLPRDLDFFVMFSSVSGIIGSQGQANYAAGNTYQDQLAKFRLGRGEKAVSLNLGPLEDAGYVAENQGMADRLINMRSVMMMSQMEVFALLDYYCNKTLSLDSIKAQIVTGLDVPADVVARGMEPSTWVYEPMFHNLHQVPPSVELAGIDDGKIHEQDLFTMVRNAESLVEAGGILSNGLAAKMCRVLSIPLETFDVAQPLHTYGVDSLVALEIRNWFLKSLNVDVAVFEILGGSTGISLGLTVAEKMRSS